VNAAQKEHFGAPVESTDEFNNAQKKLSQTGLVINMGVIVD